MSLDYIMIVKREAQIPEDVGRSPVGQLFGISHLQETICLFSDCFVHNTAYRSMKRNAPFPCSCYND